MVKKTPCIICGLVSHARGLCRKHWDEDKGYVSWHKANPEKQLQRVLRWKEANKEKVIQIQRASHKRNRAKRNTYCLDYRKRNIDRLREASRKWSKENPEAMKVTNAARRARKSLTSINSEFEKFAITEIYRLATQRTNATGIKWHVDHIIPLRSSLVCGLHCAGNLQVITALENHVKGNRVWPNMPH